MEEGKKAALGEAPVLGWKVFQPHRSPGQHLKNCPEGSAGREAQEVGHLRI